MSQTGSKTIVDLKHSSAIKAALSGSQPGSFQNVTPVGSQAGSVKAITPSGSQPGSVQNVSPVGSRAGSIKTVTPVSQPGSVKNLTPVGSQGGSVREIPSVISRLSSGEGALSVRSADQAYGSNPHSKIQFEADSINSRSGVLPAGSDFGSLSELGPDESIVTALQSDRGGVFAKKTFSRSIDDAVSEEPSDPRLWQLNNDRVLTSLTNSVLGDPLYSIPNLDHGSFPEVVLGGISFHSDDNISPIPEQPSVRYSTWSAKYTGEPLAGSCDDLTGASERELSAASGNQISFSTTHESILSAQSSSSGRIQGEEGSMRDTRRRSLQGSHVQFDETDEMREISDDESSEDEVFVEPFDPDRLKAEDYVEQREGKTFLDLSSLQLTKLPLEVGGMAQLQGIILSDNQFTRMQKAIGRLQNLEVIEARKNCIESMSPKIGKQSFARFPVVRTYTHCTRVNRVDIFDCFRSS